MTQKLSKTDLDFVIEIVQRRSGIVLTADKNYLIESRLSQIARQNGDSSVCELIKKIRLSMSESLLRQMTEAMTTNESLFFRDTKPFDYLQTEMLSFFGKCRKNDRKIRFWSAAASTGQEAYSIAMTLLEAKTALGGLDFDIVGTDLSSDAIKKATLGEYSQFEIQRGMPALLLAKYFSKTGSSFKAKPIIGNKIKFEIFNLLDCPRKFGTFDVVFLRNVLIYFDVHTKKKVLDNIKSVLAPDGFLVLGGTESTLGVTNDFDVVPSSRGIYKKNERGQNNFQRAAQQ